MLNIFFIFIKKIWSVKLTAILLRLKKINPMRIKNLIVIIATVFAVQEISAQVSTNKSADETFYTIRQTQVNDFQSQIKAYFGNRNSELFIENQTQEAVTVQIVTMDGKLSFLKATKDQLITISLKELSGKGIFILQVFDVHGNYYSKRMLVH